MVNDEPLTIFAKKSNHRCLTLSRIQLSLSLSLSLSFFLSLTLSLSLSRFQQRLLETKLLESCLPFLCVTFYQHAYMQEPALLSETHTILSYHWSVSFMLLHSLESACIYSPNDHIIYALWLLSHTGLFL